MLFDYKSGSMGGTDEISTEAMSFIVESAMLDSLSRDEISDFVADADETTSAVREGVLLEKTIVRLDKHAKLSRAYKAALFTIAREKNDPKFKKLLTVWKMERALEAYLEKKYGTAAMQRAKKMVANSSKSKSSVVQKVAKSTAAKLK